MNIVYAVPLFSGEKQWRAQVSSLLGEAGYVLDFAGVKGDGETDDGPGLQRAVDENPQIILTPPANFYLINTPINIPSERAIVGTSGDGVFAGIECRSTGTNDMFVAGGSNISISGLYLSHYGSAGSIWKNVQKDNVSLERCIVFGQNPSATDPLIYNSGSIGWYLNNRYTNERTAAWTLELDSTGGLSSIQTQVIVGNFAGNGNGILIHTSDNTNRPEGINLAQLNCVMNGGVNLQIAQVLGCYSTACTYDIGGFNSIILKPKGQGIDDLVFTSGYVATPNQLTGTAIFHDKTDGGPLARVIIDGTLIQDTGAGVFLDSTAVDITIMAHFNDIAGSAVKSNQSRKVTLAPGSTYEAVGNNIELIDGGAGGPFVVDGQQFDPAGGILLTVTHPDNFVFGTTNTGRRLAGRGSLATNDSASPSGTYVSVPHDLAGTPRLDSIQACLVATSLVISPGATLTPISANSTTIVVQVFFTVVSPGNYLINVFASL